MKKQIRIHASMGTRSRDMRTVAVLRVTGLVLIAGGITGSCDALYAIHPALLALVFCAALIIAGVSLSKVEHIEDYDDEGKHHPHARIVSRERPGEDGE